MANFVILCEINGEREYCEVVENLGYQDGNYAKVVLYKGKEIVVIKISSGFYKPKATIDKLRIGRDVGDIY